MPAQISLKLDQDCYRPGQTVRGAVHMAAHSELRPRNVALRAFGEEVTMLGPNTLMTQHSHPFDLSFNLWSPTAHDDKLPPGDYDFPFEFTLPPALPPSFNGEFTRIVYLVIAKIDLPLQADIHCELPLKVLPAPLTDVEKPVQATAQGPQGLKVTVALTRSGFYPGEHVEGTLEVTGGEAVSITAATLELLSREKAEAREFTDHFDKVRVRAEIDPARLQGGQPFPIDLPLPEDADPSFVGQHSAKSRLVRVRLDCANAPALSAEAIVRVGVK